MKLRGPTRRATGRSTKRGLASRLDLLSEAFAGVLDRRRMERALAERLRFEKLLSFLATVFSHLSAADFDSAVQRGLREVVDFLGGRGSLIEFTRDGTATRSWAVEEWVEAGEYPDLACLAVRSACCRGAVAEGRARRRARGHTRPPSLAYLGRDASAGGVGRHRRPGQRPSPRTSGACAHGLRGRGAYGGARRRRGRAALARGTLKNVVYVPGKIVNVVVA